MSEIYKVNLLNKNKIQKIYVFKGNYELNENANNITSEPFEILFFSKKN